MLRRRTMGRKKLVEIYEEITVSGNWIVPSGCQKVEAFVVAGGKNGGDSDAVLSGPGGDGGQAVLYKDIQVVPSSNVPVVVGMAGEDSFFMNTSYAAISGKGAKGGTTYTEGMHNPSNGNPGMNGVYADGMTDRFPSRYGAGGGSGAYVRGLNTGMKSGGKGGDTGGGDGASARDTTGAIYAVNGHDATFYGGGGGGASKASGSTSLPGGKGGRGYQGIIILHYWKYAV